MIVIAIVATVCTLIGFRCGRLVTGTMPPDEAAVYDAGFKAGYDQCDYDRMLCEIAAIHPQKTADV